jgi:hypothetical protein
MTLTSVITLIIALCIVSTVLWAFWTYVTIPGPLAWAKGIIMFVLIVIACYWLWTSFVGGGPWLGSGHRLR